MVRKNERDGLLKQYNNMCDEYEKIYREFIDYANSDNREEAEKRIIRLRQLNRIISNIQKKLEGMSNLVEYNSEEGYSINIISQKLEYILDKNIEHSQGMKDENGNSKYENDGLSDTRAVPKEDARKAAEAWGEGDVYLTDFLETCIENEIQTYGCCAGHEEGDCSYVLFDGMNEHVIDLSQFLIDNKIGDRIDIWRNPEVGKVFLCITVSMDKKEELYRLGKIFIDRDEPNKKDTTPSIIRRLVEIAQQIDPNEDLLYEVQEEYYYLTLKDNRVIKCTAQELEQKLKIDPTGEFLKQGEPKTVIQRLKEICSNSKFGLQNITAIKLLLIKEKELGREKQDEDTKEV